MKGNIYLKIKRLLDIMFSFLSIIVLSPVFLIVAIAIKIDSKGPVIFKQKRLGKNGKEFEMYKFRSMVVGAEKMGTGVYSKKNDDRVTKVGKFIRLTSIDELPQLVNILKGEMSFIGPRPVLTYHPCKYEEYTEEQKKRFNVRPGITGLAQINGRKQVEWDKRIKYDVEYAENVNFIMDLKIFFTTIYKVLLMKDNVNTISTVKNKQQENDIGKEQNMLKLMYITNDPEIAKIADEAGVDRVWIDLEVIGKEERQKNLDTVKSKHEIADISKVKKVLKNAELIVRVNHLYENSKNEIDAVISEGAEIVMLPFFKTAKEVQEFVNIVNKRAKVCLLCETPEAVECMDDILKIEGIDEIHIGLNDLHLGYKKDFMFELLIDGTVEKLVNKFKQKGITYGFGGIARVGTGTLPAEHIIIEHHRLGSQIAILSRSFCNTQLVTDKNEIKELFNTGIKDIRNIEKQAQSYTDEQFEKNRKMIEQEVNEIVKSIKQ